MQEPNRKERIESIIKLAIVLFAIWYVWQAFNPPRPTPSTATSTPIIRIAPSYTDPTVERYLYDATRKAEERNIQDMLEATRAAQELESKIRSAQQEMYREQTIDAGRYK